jgi:hypothetical protein
MTGAVIEAEIGADVARTLTLLDASGEPITSWSSGAVLSAVCWSGDDQQALFSPAVTWIDPALGTIAYTHNASQTAGLAPGYYQLLLTISAGSITRKGRIGVLKLLSASGAAAAPAVYCQRADLIAIAPWIESQEDLENDQNAFAAQRALAREWLDSQIVARDRHVNLAQKRRWGLWATLGVTFAAGAGYDLGPDRGPSAFPDYTLRLTEQDLRASLNANQLMRQGFDVFGFDGGSVERIAASYTLYLILDPQVGKIGETPYQFLAQKYHDRAKRLLFGWTARLDLNGDGLAEIELR